MSTKLPAAKQSYRCTKQRRTQKNVKKQRSHFQIPTIPSLFISSAAICVLSMLLAIGVFYYEIFRSYFTHPLILFLNWLPVLLLQMLFLLAFNRNWAAFLATAVVVLGASAGDFFKLKFRNEPFVFADIPSISTAMQVAGEYDIRLNGRLLLCMVAVLVITLLLAFFARKKLGGKLRVIAAVLLAGSIFPLWHFVYADGETYNIRTANYRVANTDILAEDFASKGFVYPFLYSIKEVLPPEGYSREEAKEILGQFSSTEIPEDKKVNILAFQLESFTDLGVLGFSDIDPEAYRILHRWQEEAFSGTMVANVIGGGTITSEYAFLTGTYGGLFYHSPAASYVRYLRSQGYTAVGSHPNGGGLYNRRNVNGYFGFDEYRYLDDYYEPLTHGIKECDSVVIPEVLKQYEELTDAGKKVFSFTVTLQGHGAYDHSTLPDRHFWSGEESEENTVALNNYLTSVYDTQCVVDEMLDKLRESREPAVVLLYGDHNPRLTQWFYDTLDMSREESFLRMYGTPYIIWANDAAKQICDNSFTGKGPIISPGYLMNVLFREIGWEGNDFMAFTNSVREHLPVISTNGYYLEDGNYTRTLSAQGEKLLRQYRYVQHYKSGQPDA